MLLNQIEAKILEELTKEKNENTYGNKIAKSNNLNQKTVSNALNRLEEKGILKFKREGKNKVYFLNKNSSNIKDLILMLEIDKKIRFYKKNPSKVSLFDELIARTKGILIIFGSYSSFKNNKNSDLDIAIIGDLKDIKDLEDSFGIEINPVKLSKDKFDREDNFIKELMKNHVLLKGAEEFLELSW